MAASTPALSSGASLATSTTLPPPSPPIAPRSAMTATSREEGRQRRGLGPDEAERRVVDDVRDVHAARAQHARDLVEELASS